jgi:hypothetical protein
MLNVHVRVNDSETGKPTPVRIRFAGPNGEYYAPLGRPVEFPVGRAEDVGGHVYLGGKRYAYIGGACEVPLPTGVPLEVEISKGPAYIPIRQTVTLGEGQLALRFAIRQWTDERWRNLLSADARCHFLSPHSARLEAAAEGLDLVHLLATVHNYRSDDGHAYQTVPNMTAFSGQDPALDNVYVNTMNVHPVLGSLALLHCHRAVFPLTFGHVDESDDWALSDWCDQCHRKKGLVIWSEAYRPEAGMPGGEALVNTILGKIDAIEIDAFERSAPFVTCWYRLLNSGIRLPIVGSSGKDSNRIAAGGMRTLTLRDAEPAYPEWVEQVRQGRTVASNGPFLGWKINGEEFPTRIQHSEMGDLRVEVEAASIAPFEKIEIVANGEVVASRSSATGEVATATLEAEVRLSGGGWVAARCWGSVRPGLYPHVPVFAHSSACFVEVAGRLPFQRPAAVKACLKEIEAVRSWVETGGTFRNPRRREYLLSLCDMAAGKLAAPS